MIKINEIHGFTVFDGLISLKRQNLHPFDKVTLPQKPEFLPKNLRLGGLEHALYLFYICLYMRGPITSKQAFEEFKKLYEYSPDLFDPKKIKNNPTFYTNILIEQLKKGRLAMRAEDNARFWIENSKELFLGGWQGDPRNLFNVINDKNRNTSRAFELLCKNIIRGRKKIDSRNRNFFLFDINDSKNRGFYGFLEKMVSMLSYFYVDANIIPSFHFPSPVDFHLSRIFVMQRIVIVTGNINEINAPIVLPAGRKITASYTAKNHVSPKELSDAIWSYSQKMCSKNPNNTRLTMGEPDGRKTVFTIAKKVKWTKSNIRKHDTSCGRCIFNETCTSFVPSGPYYTAGKLLMIKRDYPIQESLFPPATEQIEISKVETRVKKTPIKIDEDQHPSLFNEKNYPL